MKVNNRVKYTIILVGLIVTATIAVSIGLYWQSQSNQPRQAVTTSPASSASSTSNTSSPSVSNPGTYIDYSPEAVLAANGHKKVLFFYAGWCPSCRQQDAGLTAERSKIPDNTTIFKVDFDSVIDLRQKYGVTIQHTFVQIDDEGNEIQQWNSLYKQNNLQSILNRIN